MVGFLFDKKEVHLSVLIASRDLFAGSLFWIFNICLSLLLILSSEGNSVNQQARLRDNVSAKFKVFYFSFR